MSFHRVSARKIQRSVPDIIVKSFEDLYSQHPDLFDARVSSWAAGTLSA